jgi:peptide/nickel transport system substrate-binding protein
MAYAVDRRFVIDNIWFGFGKPATGPMSSNFAPSGLYTAEVTQYQGVDGIERANKLLDEAGLPKKDGGIRFEIVHDITPYGPEWQRFGEFVQQRLALVGIKATLRYEDVATWLKRIYTDYDFFLTSNFLYNLPDPVLGVHRAIHGKLIKQGTVFVNGSQWSNPRSDELMDKATIEPDAKKRAEYYHEVQKIAVEASPIIWVFELNFPTVVNKRYHDVITSPLGLYTNFATVWRE